MSASRFPGRRVRRGRPGLPGSESLPTGWATSIEGRLGLLEEAGTTVATSDLTDVGDLTAIADGEFLSWDADGGEGGLGEFVPSTFPTLDIDYDMAFVFDGGGSAIPAKNWYQSFRLSYNTTIRGYTLASPGGGTIEAEVSRATYAAHPTYTAISGSSLQRPKLTTGEETEFFVLTGWTTALNDGDFLRIATIAGATSVYATLTLHMRRTLTLG